MLAIAKGGGGLLELSSPLDKDVERAVRQYVSDFVVVKERFERPEPDHVVAEVSGERHFLQLVELNPIFGCNFADQLRYFHPQRRARNTASHGRVDPSHQNRADSPLQLAERGQIRERRETLSGRVGYDNETRAPLFPPKPPSRHLDTPPPHFPSAPPPQTPPPHP